MQPALTEEEVKQAWQMECNGEKRHKVAYKFHCAEVTLEKAYKRHGLKPPHRGHYKRKKK